MNSGEKLAEQQKCFDDELQYDVGSWEFEEVELVET